MAGGCGVRHGAVATLMMTSALLLLLLPLPATSALRDLDHDSHLELYRVEGRGTDSGEEINASPHQRTPEALADRVSYLPGWGEPHFGLFSGYVTVDEDAGRALFYALAESMVAPETAPLVLWLNGGPGCSSLGGGFLSELGPYYPRTLEGKLQSNPNSWNREANVLFIESPAFVGFSYSNTTSDGVVGDERTAADSYQFLLRLFERFPQYADRPLWLSGESYAGHYVPGLAAAIVDGNEKGQNPKINLKGFLVGNPLTDTVIDNHGAVDYWNGHAIISTGTAAGIKEYCDFNTVGPLLQSEVAKVDQEKCDYYVDKSAQEMGNINIYDIFADVCLPQEKAVVQQLASALQGTPAGLRFGSASLQDSSYDPCVDSEVAEYFNKPEVQRAMHANVTGSLKYPWTDCTEGSRLQYSRDDLLASMMPVYDLLLTKGLSILVYSGDVDAILPVTGTRRWVEALGLDTVEEWRPWTSSTGQVAGWTQGFSNGLTFATVRGAGHMVPYTQPERGYSMVMKFINGRPL